MRITAAIVTAACLTLLAIAAPAGVPNATAQQPACLHGPDEQPAQKTRRQQALGFVRHVNTLEATAAARSSAYVPADRLTLSQALPAGFQLHLSASERAYAFSATDTTDPCRFAYFSDEAGIIYRGEAIRGLD